MNCGLEAEHFCTVIEVHLPDLFAQGMNFRRRARKILTWSHRGIFVAEYAVCIGGCHINVIRGVEAHDYDLIGSDGLSYEILLHVVGMEVLRSKDSKIRV